MTEYVYDDGHIPKSRTKKLKLIKYIIDKNGCHICTSHYLRNGYPIIIRNMNQWNLSRWIWTIERGEIPDGLVVRHKCDEPSCINIEHLELGTTADNSTDKVQRNRQTKGEDVVISVLTEHQVVEIRKSNNTIAEIAREYGVSYSTVRAVITGETWKHIAVESNIKPRYRNLSKRKLSQEQAEQIRADTEHTYKELAEMFGVNRGVIQRIKTGECYKV